MFAPAQRVKAVAEFLCGRRKKAAALFSTAVLVDEERTSGRP